MRLMEQSINFKLQRYQLDLFFYQLAIILIKGRVAMQALDKSQSPLQSQYLKQESSVNTHHHRIFTSQSYQEYQLRNIQQTQISLAPLIHQFHLEVTQALNTQFLDNILRNHTKYFSSILAYCDQVHDILSQASLFSFSHQNYASQSALLAFYLAKKNINNQVILIISEDSLSQISHIIAGDIEDDKVSFTKNLLRRQGVVIQDLKQWRKEGLNFSPDAFTILDVFGVNPIEYSPFLLSNFSNLIEAKKTFIYHSHLQNEEIQSFLKMLSAESFPLQLWASYPIEYIVEKEEKKILEQLIDFLKEDINHPEKHDVVIFYPVNQDIKHFASKLSDAFSQKGLKQYLLVISKPFQRQSRSKNSIFIADGTGQLQGWNYDYSKVLYVIDYGMQSRFTFNYQLCSYEEQICWANSYEKAKRYSLVGNNQFGIYACVASHQINSYHFLDNAKDISFYLLKMIYYNLTHHLNVEHKRVVHGLELLQKLAIIKQQNNQFKIFDQSSIAYAIKGISPLQYKFILSFLNGKEPSKSLNLAIYMSIFLHSKQSIKKKRRQQSIFLKPKQAGMWNKRDYMQSCCAIIARCQANQMYLQRQGQNLSFRRSSSQFEQSQNDPFRSIYQVIDTPNGQQSEKLLVPNFLQENLIDQEVFFRVREQIDQYRQIFGVVKVPIILEQEDFDLVIKQYVSLFKRSLLFYSGYARKGYQSQNSALKNQNIQIEAESLKRQQYIKPLFLTVLRYRIKQGKQEILIWNAVSQTMYLQVNGALPIIEKGSECQAQIQFHGISSLVFRRLWRNNGIQMYDFEQQHNCFIEPHYQMALVAIYCDLYAADTIKIEFQRILTKTRDTISASNRAVESIGNFRFYLGAGGIVKEMSVGGYINIAFLQNIHNEITKRDLQELFEQFVIVRDINMQLPQNGEQTKSAYVFFNSQRDYYTFYRIFSQCQYYGYTLKVSPIHKQKVDLVQQKQYIEFRWFIWQAREKALISFQSQEGAKTAYQALTNNPQLDGSKVHVELNGTNLLIEGINQNADQIFIQQALSDYGPIQQIQILKIPLKQTPKYGFELEDIIFKATQNKDFKLQEKEKGKNGLRKCKVNFKSQQDLIKVANSLNRTICGLGKTRIYTNCNFQRIIKIGDSIERVVIQIVQEILVQLQDFKLIRPKIVTYKIKHNHLFLHSQVYQAIKMVFTIISKRIQGQIIKLKNTQKSIIFNQLGLANLLHLQQKYNCKLITNMATQTLSVICKQKIAQQIEKEIEIQLSSSFFYKIYLHSKAYHYFSVNNQILPEIKQKYKLKLVELQLGQKSIMLQGSIVNVQTAIVYFMYLIQTLANSQENMVNSDVCKICYEQPIKSYRLQFCFHRFCLSCLHAYIKNVLGDISQLPIKCPHCSQAIIIEDLEVILDKNQWQKLQYLSVCKFISENSDKAAFCYTAGCRQINVFESQVWKCKRCKLQYCNYCKQHSHLDLTCRQALDLRQSDHNFLNFLLDNNAKICPNCKTPIIKFIGCDHVTCTRCRKPMDFGKVSHGYDYLSKMIKSITKNK